MRAGNSSKNPRSSQPLQSSQMLNFLMVTIFPQMLRDIESHAGFTYNDTE